MSIYHETYAAWQENPIKYWGNAAKAIDWVKRPDAIFDASQGAYGRWFVGGKLNTCYNAVDRHVKNGRGAQTAFIYDSPVTNTIQHVSYEELLHEVSSLAALLVDMGVEKGDRVIIYMPMILEAAYAMLACARIGAIHSVVFGGFAAKELATRIDDCKAKLILSASCGIEVARIVPYKPLLDEAIKLASHKIERVLLLQRPQCQAEMGEGDYDWQECLQEVKDAGDTQDCVPVLATDPLYILYTSGTTGIPKGVVRDNGGHAVALFQSMHLLYGMEAGDVWWTASDVGWVVGHSYIVYGPLLRGCTSVLYEGKPVGTPDAGAFFRVIEQHKVKAFFTAPTAFRAVKKEDPEGVLRQKYDTSTLQTLFLAGERADPDTIRWSEKLLNVPVIDHWWQTETGWCMAGNPVGLGLLPVKIGSPTVALPGFDVRILDEAGKEVKAGQTGAIGIKLPLPPGALPTLWQNDTRFVESYLSTFQGYYSTSDGYKDADGYLYVMGRLDDIINVAGHRLSTGGMEEVLSSHPDVAECAVIGLVDELKGEVPCGFIVLKQNVKKSESDVEKECVALVREKIGPVAAFKLAVVVARLPKTRSGKILRATMKKIADNTPYTVPATIDDPLILEEIKDKLVGRI
jgi:propionyl-CoA synthetase